MPSWTASSPIVAEGLVFTLAEPHTLVCADAGTGRILWQRENDQTEGLPDAEREAARRLYSQWQARIRAVLSKSAELRLQEDVLLCAEGLATNAFKSNLQVKLTPDIRDRRAARARDETPEQRARRRARIEALRAERPDWGKDPNRVATGLFTGETLSGFRAAQKELARAGFLFESWAGLVGHTFATPVTDGKRLWASFGWGQVVCYDFDGRRVWFKWFAPAKGGELLYTNSPLLAGDRLVVIAGGFVRALHKDTGETLWETAYKTAAENHSGSPIVVRLAGEDILVTTHGALYRLRDGKIVATGLSEQVGAPTAFGDRLFLNTGIVHGTESKLHAFGHRLAWDGTDAVRVERLWSTPVSGRAGIWVGPVFHDGLLYFSYPQNVAVLDAAAGQPVIRHVPNEFAFTGSHAPNNVIAGNHLFAGNCHGQTLVVETGRAGKPVACNVICSDLWRDHVLLDPEELEKRYWSRDLFPAHAFTASTPFFAGRHVYLRSYEALYGIAADGTATEPSRRPIPTPEL
jgi:outer membrane protein assembly factor BamB